ncbi:MAG TPA: hypothetical protein VFM77_02880 [Terriglobales bacterium]|nr:hypothetical protein [Terriglobales bacterium]
MSAKVDPLFAGSQFDRGTVKQEPIWKRRFIDAVLLSVAVLSLTALALRLFGR